LAPGNVQNARAATLTPIAGVADEGRLGSPLDLDESGETVGRL
jgi:hypothetical protein